MSDDEPARLTAWVRGRVQGVGFRWWVRSIALELGLLGAAENLVDGRVKVIAEGDRENCALLLERLEAPGSPGHVVQVTHRWDKAGGGFTGFTERLTRGTPSRSPAVRLVTWADANLTGRVLRWDHGGVTCAQLARFMRLFLRARPLWSLSVEDLKQWRRLCLAMLAGRIRAWFLRCADCSDEYATWRPSLPGFKR